MTVEQIAAVVSIVLAIGGLLYKQIEINETVKTVLKDVSDNESRIKEVENDLHITIKEQGKQTNESITELTKAVTELVISNRLMAVKLEHFEKTRP